MAAIRVDAIQGFCRFQLNVTFCLDNIPVGAATMTLNNICRDVMNIPLADHKGWRSTLLFFQSVCLVVYAACAWLHRNRIFCSVIFRKWDLDLMFMLLSLAAASTGVVTWTSWVETNFSNVRADTANANNDPQAFSEAKQTAWIANAVYLTFKPVSIGLYALVLHQTNNIDIRDV